MKWERRLRLSHITWERIHYHGSICKCNCSSRCIGRHSTETYRGRRCRWVLMADGTWPRRTRCHRKAHPHTSSCRKESRVEAIGGYHQASKPLFSHQIPPSHKLKILLQKDTERGRNWGTAIKKSHRLLHVNSTINHLTLATTPLQEGRDILPYDFYKVIMRKSSWQHSLGDLISCLLSDNWVGFSFLQIRCT